MICYTVSKYDNKVKNHNEWTDYSDIRKVFDGKKLTIDEYLSVEQNYIDFILEVLKLNNVLDLTLTELEVYENIKWTENQTINVSVVPAVIKDILRNKCWCKLKGDGFCLCFGFDFYMHIKSNIDYACLVKLCNRYGLYIKNDKIS